MVRGRQSITDAQSSFALRWAAVHRLSLIWIVDGMGKLEVEACATVWTLLR